MDFYVLLGLERDASTAAVKRAYRRLARRLHPDINPGDREAAARFQQILDAYEGRIAPDRRRRYDAGALGAAREDAGAFGFAGFDFSTRATGPQATTFGDLFADVLTRRREPGRIGERGADIHVKASLSFEEAWRGLPWAVTITRQDVCRACAGSGSRQTVESTCQACDGAGVVRSVRGHMVFARNCARCGGRGRLRERGCEACQSQGVERRSESLTVDIPAGIADGARVRVPARGHAGVRGGAPGDLYLEVEVRPDEVFRRSGDDLHLELPVEIHEAALGARIEVPTPDGTARVRIPPGTQSGQRFRLRERGAPSARSGARGDLIVHVRVMLPSVLDERSKELLREFGRINGASVRRVWERRPAPG